MTKSSTDLENTLISVGETTNLLVESQYSSTKKGGLTTMTASQLMQNAPEENDKSLLALLKRTLKFSITCTTKSKLYATGWEPSYEVHIKGLTPEKRQAALKIIREFNIPMSDEHIVKLMTRLAIISPEKQKSTYDMKARAAIWCDELRRYPADVVNRVLRDRYRWFPTLAEVMEKCENEIAYRKLIERGIRVSV